MQVEIVAPQDDDDDEEKEEEEPSKKKQKLENNSSSSSGSSSSSSSKPTIGVRVLNGDDVVVVPTTEEWINHVFENQEARDAYKQIQQLQQQCLQQADEKVTVARQAYEIVDATVRRLDKDLKTMEQLMQVRIYWFYSTGQQERTKTPKIQTKINVERANLNILDDDDSFPYICPLLLYSPFLSTRTILAFARARTYHILSKIIIVHGILPFDLPSQAERFGRLPSYAQI